MHLPAYKNNTSLFGEERKWLEENNKHHIKKKDLKK